MALLKKKNVLDCVPHFTDVVLTFFLGSRLTPSRANRGQSRY